MAMATRIIQRMRHTFQTLALAILVTASVSTQTPPTPVKIDGTGGARTAKQTRPPDNRRPRGTAVGLLGWRAGIRSDAFGAMPFLDAAARIDAAGVAFVEAVSTNLDYRLGADELANIKARLTDLGLRVPAYRIDAIPADEASRSKLLDFAKALEIELILHEAAGDASRASRSPSKMRAACTKRARRRSAPIFATPRRPRRCCSS